MQDRNASLDSDISPRQAEVLDATLRELVEGMQPLTMAAVAKRASCSKETLYKWFGDRDGLITATVRYQASRVHVAAVEPGRLDLASLSARLNEFAANWLRVISSDTSIALNRVAIAHSGGEGRPLGSIVLENGRFALGARLKPILEAGRAAGLLAFDDAEEAFRCFFGLFARDVQIRLLLGDDLRLGAAEIAEDAARATRQFLVLYASQPQTGEAG
jgi:AcrR family transcriptional regulator